MRAAACRFLAPLLFAAAPGALCGEPRYLVVPLGNTPSSARAINDRQQIVGLASLSNGQDRAFLWENGQMRNLGVLPGGAASGALGINFHGQIAGQSLKAESCGGSTTVQHACLFTASTLEDINVATGCYSSAYSITDNGLIVGLYRMPNDPKYRGYLYNAGTTQFIDLSTRAWGDGSSSTYDVNTATQVVGTLYKFDQFSNWWPFLWMDQNGNGSNDIYEAIELKCLGGRFGEARAINNHGQIVGAADVVSYQTPPYSHAFLVTPDQGVWFRDLDTNGVNDLMRDLGTLGGSQSAAYDINDHGQVVGFSTLSNNVTRHAVLWEGGAPIDLNDLIPTNAGWVLDTAYGINRDGEIVGVGVYAGDTNAFLLTGSFELKEDGVRDDGRFFLHWSPGSMVTGAPPVFTVEARASETEDWSPVLPTGQWPITGTWWTNAADPHPPSGLFRVRAFQAQ